MNVVVTQRVSTDCLWQSGLTMSEARGLCRGHGGFPHMYTRTHVKIYKTKCKLLGPRIGVCSTGMT